MNKLKCSAITNRGNLRENNEDNFFAFGKTLNSNNMTGNEVSICCKHQLEARSSYVCVCDGMGGMNAGEKASAFAVEAMSEFAEKLTKQKPKKASQLLDEYISQVNAQLYSQSQNTEHEGMGTTLAGLVINEAEAVSINVGDSRCYLLRGGRLRQLSTDHSEAARLVNLGMMKEEDARGSKERSMLYRYIGTPPEAGKLQCSISESIKIKEGDIFLLCSDGLTDMVENEQITEILSSAESSEHASRLLVDAALENGGKDNVTVLILTIENTRNKADRTKLAIRIIIAIMVICSVAIAALLIVLLGEKTDSDIKETQIEQQIHDTTNGTTQ